MRIQGQMSTVSRSEKVQGEWIKRKDSSLAQEFIWDLIGRASACRVGEPSSNPVPGEDFSFKLLIMTYRWPVPTVEFSY